MLNEVINLVKQEALGAITNNANIPADKRDAAVETTTSAIVDSFKDHFTPDNLSNIAGLLGGSSSSSSSISNNLQNSVVSALSEKVGISKDVANSIATAVIPAVIGLFTKKVNDSNEPGFNIESLVKAFTGSNGGGILGTLGKLFGK